MNLEDAIKLISKDPKSRIQLERERVFRGFNKILECPSANLEGFYMLLKLLTT
jgi:hypothetical protein